jgi:NTE family protein
MSNDRPTSTLSLVLGSGGARGCAHIGVIRGLEETGYRIESISGCSMGRRQSSISTYRSLRRGPEGQS